MKVQTIGSPGKWCVYLRSTDGNRTNTVTEARDYIEAAEKELLNIEHVMPGKTWMVVSVAEVMRRESHRSVGQKYRKRPRGSWDY